VSYGVIVYCPTTARWLLVRTGVSYAFNSLLNGMFQKSDIPTILSLVTPDEFETVKKLYHGVLNYRDYYYGNHLKEGEARWAHNRELLRPYLQHPPAPTSTPWSFPKGRQEGAERPLECALREYEEETGLSAKDLGLPLDPDPVCENYISFDHTVYETKCWVFCLPVGAPEPPLTPPDNQEIVERRWVSTEEAERLLSSSKSAMLAQARVRIEPVIRPP
jgi:ADP-ribose pyrophosphatase YjhB (NUDIX family)